jgi:hypothetical protein
MADHEDQQVREPNRISGTHTVTINDKPFSRSTSSTTTGTDPTEVSTSHHQIRPAEFRPRPAR